MKNTCNFSTSASHDASSERYSAGLSRRATALLLAALPAVATAATDGERMSRLAPDAQAAVRAELRELKARIAALEQLLDPDAPVNPATDAAPALRSQAVLPATAEEAVEAKPTTLARAAASADPTLEIGGAVRFNYGWQDFSERSKDHRGDFEIELFRLGVDGQAGPFTLSAEYRWYNTFETIHHAWVGYAFGEQWEARLGISQVPFGLLPFASHSFWFGAGYYLGLEDDYDAGLQLIHDNGPWQAHFAFFKNPEYADSSRYGRYSFDIATGNEQQNEEVDQWNARLRYRWQHGGERYSDVGASAQWGRLYNAATGRDGDRHAWALHWDGHYGPWNLQLQWASYRFEPANPPGVSRDTVQLAAFDAPFLAAAEADVATANLAYTFTLGGAVIDSITCYNDYSSVHPTGAGQRDSIQNVTGCLLVAGSIYTYVDWITGKNIWFSNGPGVGLDANDSNSRLNINVGYYF